MNSPETTALERPVISVVIPAHNEASTLPDVVSRALDAAPGFRKEILVVDDGSTDGMLERLVEVGLEPVGSGRPFPGIDAIGTASPTDLGRTPTGDRVLGFRHARRSGKGAALRTAQPWVSGELVVIQDADLEYDPADWCAMLAAHASGIDVVYGSRLLSREPGAFRPLSLLANRTISGLFSLLYGRRLTDVQTCYKMCTRSVWANLTLNTNDFGIEIEISARIARTRSWRIREVPISYWGRSYAAGKKVGWRDGFRALWYLIRFRGAAFPGGEAVMGGRASRDAG